MEIEILFHLAIIIFFSKVAGAVCNRFKQPPVIGMLLLGIILGPTMLHLIEPEKVIRWIAQIGVLFYYSKPAWKQISSKLKRFQTSHFTGNRRSEFTLCIGFFY